ncbi:sensor histidine kinase [Paenibacillus koleovorans]|uniref:sensor histidine kinase n=1 Tax=Paenibacillus koleovorans TaxID=121608 RepID=UPI000FD7ECEE|nr:ATP-binding protein [Paenibacillus koleovorans]
MEHSSLGLQSIDMVKIIGNLLDNAFDESIKLPQDQRVVELECHTEQNRFVAVMVRNRGTYISDEVQAKLFEPGFSTKADGHQGLGLPIVKERIAFYQGTIHVQSNPEEGTSFHIRIPLKKR